MSAGTRDNTPQHACWQVGDSRIDLHWQPPLTLLSLEICAQADTVGDDARQLPPALLCLACEVLLQKLGLDDPLLAALLPLRMTLLETLAGTVPMTDRRPLLQDGKVAILRMPLTT